MAGVYRGTVTKDNCQSPATTQQIAVFANPTVPNFTQAGNTLTGPANMSHYMWIVDGTDTLAADTRIIEAPISGSYVLIVTNAGGCSNTSVPKNVLVTGVRNATSQNAVSAFPVPATDWLVVNLQNSGNQTIALFNSLGKNILPTICIQRENNQEKLSIQHLAPGTYWIQVLESNKLTTIPIIKAK